MPTLKAYRMNWPVVPDRLYLVSIGAGLQRTLLRQRKRFHNILEIPLADSVEFSARTLSRQSQSTPVMNESSSLTNTDGEKFRHALVHAPHFTSLTTLEFQAPGDREVFHLHF